MENSQNTMISNDFEENIGITYSDNKLLDMTAKDFPKSAFGHEFTAEELRKMRAGEPSEVLHDLNIDGSQKSGKLAFAVREGQLHVDFIPTQPELTIDDRLSSLIEDKASLSEELKGKEFKGMELNGKTVLAYYDQELNTISYKLPRDLGVPKAFNDYALSPQEIEDLANGKRLKNIVSSDHVYENTSDLWLDQDELGQNRLQHSHQSKVFVGEMMDKHIIGCINSLDADSIKKEVANGYKPTPGVMNNLMGHKKLSRENKGFMIDTLIPKDGPENIAKNDFYKQNLYQQDFLKSKKKGAQSKMDSLEKGLSAGISTMFGSM